MKITNSAKIVAGCLAATISVANIILVANKWRSKNKVENTPTILDVAQYILEKNGKISTWKLQKLCYYSQAWALAWTELPLFEDEFEAWANGPVSPVLFAVRKGEFLIDVTSGTQYGDSGKLSPDQIDTINNVLEHYGDYKPYTLREQTHSESPWIDARKGIPDGEPSNAVISKERMKEYYGGL